MTTIRERCVYVCGPYKGYCGRAEYEDSAFHGEVIGTRDVITFQGSTLDEAREAFVESVDDYLAFCEGDEARPEKPFSGKFVARLDPELHKTISNMADASGKSLNQFICDCLAEVAKRGISTPIIAEPVLYKSRKSSGAQKRAKRGRSKDSTIRQS